MEGKQQDIFSRSSRHFIDALAHFGIGFSWGGYESLVVPSDPAGIRTATAWTDSDPLVRLSIGLEDPADLIADLTNVTPQTDPEARP